MTYSAAQSLVLCISLTAQLAVNPGDRDFFGSVGEGAYQVGAIDEATRHDDDIAGWVSSGAVEIDDCSVFLAYGDREDYRIVDCVGVEIRAADFEMPPWPYFLVSPEGEILDIADMPVVVTLSEFQSLPIERGELVMQPPSAEVLINLDTIAYSTARTHILTTRILGTPVAVRATPIAWTWDFGAGTQPFTTSGPGGPYPNREVSRVYRQVASDVRVGLAITWEGEYRVNNAGPWLPIAGTTTTSLASAPFATVEAPARLVAGALNEG